MNNSKIIKYAVMGAAGAIAYIALIALFLSNVEKIFGPGPDKGVLPAMAFLTTLVLSAATMGTLIFARPILWYLDGLKKEAVRLLFYTLGFLFLAVLFVLALLIA